MNLFFTVLDSGMTVYIALPVVGISGFCWSGFSQVCLLVRGISFKCSEGYCLITLLYLHRFSCLRFGVCV